MHLQGRTTPSATCMSLDATSIGTLSMPRHLELLYPLHLVPNIPFPDTFSRHLVFHLSIQLTQPRRSRLQHPIMK